MQIKKHIIGFSKTLQPHEEGLNWILGNGEENLQSFQDERFKNWYSKYKPAFFEKLGLFEECAKEKGFALSFYIYPNIVDVHYGFERLHNSQTLTTDGWSHRNLVRNGKTSLEADRILLKEKILQWQSTLSSYLNNRISPFLSNDENLLARVSLLRETPDFEKFQDCISQMSITLDSFAEGRI